MAAVKDGVLGLTSNLIYKDPNCLSEMKQNFGPKVKDQKDKKEADDIISKNRKVSYIAAK